MATYYGNSAPERADDGKGQCYAHGASLRCGTGVLPFDDALTTDLRQVLSPVLGAAGYRRSGASRPLISRANLEASRPGLRLRAIDRLVDGPADALPGGGGPGLRRPPRALLVAVDDRG
jgi:hypothetical protein